MSKSSNINIISQALLKASKILRRDFHELENLQNSLSKIHIFVSRSLANVKETLFQELSKARPDWIIFFHDEVNEVNTKLNCDNIKLLIKPISGILNYSNGISYFTTSVTLINKGLQEAAVIYDPIKDELFYAERGKGAFVNNFRIRTSSNRDLKNSVIIFENENLISEKIKLILKEKNANARIFGCSCLDFANLAAGRFDCYISNISSVESEPGLLLLKEAGGIDSEILDLKETFFYSNNLISEIIKKK